MAQSFKRAPTAIKWAIAKTLGTFMHVILNSIKHCDWKWRSFSGINSHIQLSVINWSNKWWEIKWSRFMCEPQSELRKSLYLEESQVYDSLIESWMTQSWLIPRWSTQNTWNLLHWKKIILLKVCKVCSKLYADQLSACFVT